MKKISYEHRYLEQWITSSEMESYSPSVGSAERALTEKTGLGSDFLGWLRLPEHVDTAQVDRIAEKAHEVRSEADVLVSIGIGGSYLGSRAAIEFLGKSFDDQRSPRVIFAGHQVNSDYLTDLLELIEDKNVAVNVISKSGTTTEPGITFRVLRQWMEKRYGREGAAKRIIATTDPAKGALRELATEEGYATFDIPPDVGGRFSVLTPVGLLPIAVAGIDIRALLRGAAEIVEACRGEALEKNMAARYAVVRNILFRRGKMIEMLATFNPSLHYIVEWWKQLAGESEGKNLTGIFPVGADYTTDLHSLGQWMQEGTRNIFETFIIVNKTRSSVAVPRFEKDGDGLNYLAGKSFEEINENAYKGTLLAHLDGDVPASTITIEDRTPEALGQ
ncbi:MAG: glucose-6-phosphate isomerase, partial [Chitinivibrionales bacterium]|nr:glucose-6-phosphate isomerase [Chitinivibrionales bacterium]MBD3358465.1 glucose-6-phosphate isomerase [Chitinivibrionales bacterium]